MSASAPGRRPHGAGPRRRSPAPAAPKFRAPGPAALRRALPPLLWACIERVVAAAEESGAQIFLVGGPVRDLLLRRPLRDADLAVAPPPGRTRPAAREVARAARRAGERVVAHERFGSVQFHGAWGALDLTTLRAERFAAPGALPTTRPGSLAEDLQRRDFTVNALALPLGSAARAAHPRLVDPGGGLADLAARRLRIFHARSFHDDPTRALRAARLAPRLGFRLQPATRAVLADAMNSGALDAVSGERIRAELVKLFAEAPLGLDPAAALGLLERWRVLAALSPGLSLPRTAAGPLRRLGRLLADAEAVRLAPGPRGWLVGLMLWFAALPLPLRRRALRRLAITGQAARRVIAFARLRALALRGLQRGRGRGAADAVLGKLPPEELLALWAGAPAALGRRIARYAREDRHAKPPLSGEDLLRLGMRGPEIGRALARLRAAHLDGLLGSRARALSFARELVRRKPDGVRSYVGGSSRVDQTHLHEHDFNAALGKVIQQQRAAWRKDTDSVVSERQGGILEAGTKHGRRADVLLQPGDMQPVAMEVKFALGAGVEQSAIKRIEAECVRNGRIIRTAFAVIAPEDAKNWRSRDEAAAKLAAGAQLQYCAFIRRPIDSPGEPERWPDAGFISGTAATLAEAAAAIATPVHEIKLLAVGAAVQIRGKANLLTGTTRPHVLQQITAVTGQDSPIHGMEIACCIWLNALLLQNKIAASRKGGEIRAVNELHSELGMLFQHRVQQEWSRILDINYASIYEPAKETLHPGLNTPYATETLTALAEKVVQIDSALLGPLNDIGGELFPKLTQDRKEAAQFYTRPEAAALLAHLAIPDDAAPPGAAKSWADAKGLMESRLGDFACGTGTLLRAGYRRIRTLHERAGGDASKIHQSFMENCICGTDISPIAYHLTAAGLSAMDAMHDYTHNNIGMCTVKRGLTGALEFYLRDEVAELMQRNIRAAAGKPKARRQGQQITARRGSFDYVLMNPPYSRSRGGQSTFDVAGLSEKDRKLCQQRARRQFKDTPANFQAGLATAFTVLADKKLRGGGRLGIVLPLTMAAASTWKKVRAMFARDYCRVTIVTYTADERRQQALSEDTDLGELMICATRLCRRAADRKSGETPGMGLAVNLSQPPRHQAEAVEVALAIRKAERSAEGGQAEGVLRIGSGKIGEWCSMALPEDGAPWTAVGGQSSDLTRIAGALCEGRVLFPSETRVWKLPLPMRHLEQVFKIGPTHHLIGHLEGREAIGAFEMHPLEEKKTKSHLALWKADARAQTQLTVRATHHGIAKGAKKQTERMKKLAGRLFYQRNMRWNSQALLTATTAESCLGGRAWVALLHETVGIRQAYALWSNSTLGMLVHWAQGQRQDAGRSTMQVRAIHQLPVPDFTAQTKAGERARKVARKHFSRLSGLELQPAGMGFDDPARREIDSAVCEMLGVPRKHHADLQRMARMLAQEPSVNGGHRKILAALRE